jgi:glycosyltransferase involved in cell wall biosynthesis
VSEPSTHDPLVSIVIPSHNRPVECIRAVKSALNQTWNKLEIIVVDDASREDMTLFEEFVHSQNQAKSEANLKPASKNIQWIRLKENRGACHARNIGLQEAQGEYINFLDDDDEIYPEKIEKQLRVFADSNDPELAVVTSHMNDARSGDERLTFNHHRGRIYPDILASWFVKGIHTSLFKREALLTTGGFDEKLEANQEYDLMIRLMEHHTLDYVDEALCIAHRSRDQISLNFGKKRRGARYLFQKHTGRFKAEGLSFYLKMWIKYRLLDVRFWVGQRFGERAYRMLTPK